MKLPIEDVGWLDGKVGGRRARLPASLACRDDVNLSLSQVYINSHPAIESQRRVTLVIDYG